MSLPLESSTFQDIIVVLGAAGLVIPAFAALRISPVVGFILVGVAVGPFGIGHFAPAYPWLGNFTISHAETLAAPAEIGIALLLFALGLELSIERLRTMRVLVFRTGIGQIVACTFALILLLLPFALSPTVTLTLALALSLSSTAVGLQMLSASGRMGTQAGRTAFGILLAQDIAIAPLLLLLSAGSAADGFISSLAMGLLAIGGVALAGRLLLPALFLQAARTRRPELFLAAALVVLIGSSVATASVGLSPAVGALVAGVMLAETDYRRQVEAAIAPFQGLLLGVFLIWVGMQLDLGAVLADPLLILGGVFAVCAVKAAVIFVLLRWEGRGTGVAGHVATLLAAPSETSLILLGTAAATGLTGGGAAQTALLVTGLALAIAPLLGLLGQHIETRFGAGRAATAASDTAAPDRTVIIGFGRVGRLVAAMLDTHEQPYIAVDSDPDEVIRLRAAGKPVIYGDARRPELLDALHLETARAVVLTIDAADSLDTLVRLIRERHPALCVVVRARDADHASRLYAQGVTDAVPETIESSLQLAEAVLVDLGVPMGPVIASIHEKRAELRSRIQAGGPTRPRRAVRRRSVT
ncbi:cation:proton antiporter [Sandarakinorhabdus sp. DWP1-3-1]|uniref:cation:proton antiporter domain-containing protein n=1 Tax=Sandarakinorhabdus sp. DWP1-3-1 TaxID=2804627 RepID=UPI003CEBC7FF